MRFGASTVSWPVSSADFLFQQQRDNTCVGAFVAIDTAGGSGVPPWIVGDTFLKNVYSVYQGSSTPAVGFAKLSNVALAMNGRNESQPNPTSGVRDKSNGALPRSAVAVRWVAAGAAAAAVVGGLVL